MKTIGFVIATKDRPDDLRRMLRSIATQTHQPDLVIIVDSSTTPVSVVADEFSEMLRMQYIHHLPPSASAQRNAGIDAIQAGVELIAFLDDDATLEPGALEAMLAFWADAPSELGGAAFNMVNHPIQTLSSIKRGTIVSALGLYGAQPGQVAKSGWQSMTGFVAHNISVDWLASGAVVWRSEVVNECRFDEFFDGYSYLEDLEHSYRIGRHWRLAVVANAHYHHFPSPIRHVNQYGFGKTEVRNRVHFVVRHGLSYPKCWLGLLVRSAMTFCHAVSHLDRGSLSRMFGNFSEMAIEARTLLTKNRVRSKSEFS
jgi:glycosyltransferase involved in cell wall biosynthesis